MSRSRTRVRDNASPFSSGRQSTSRATGPWKSLSRTIGKAQQRHLELRVDLISLISPPVYRRLVFGAGHRDCEYFVRPGRSMRELLLNCSENRTSSEEELHGPRGGVRRPKQTSWGNQPSPLRLAFEQSQAP